MSSIIRKVKSLPALIKKRKSSQKLENLCDSIPLPYERPPSRPQNWLFLERCRLMMDLVDYFIATHNETEDSAQGQKEVWYWANDFDEEYPMTYQVDDNCTVSDSLLQGLELEPTPTTPLTMNQQTTLARHFKTYRPPRRL